MCRAITHTLVACAALLLLAPLGELRAAEKSVTTTWLPDPFPNQAPRALDRQAIVEVDAPRRTPSVLLGVYDVENDPLSVTSFTQPAHGSAMLEKDGTFRYAPQAGYAGRDEFTFTLGDGRGGLSTAVIADFRHPAPNSALLPSNGGN